MESQGRNLVAGSESIYLAVLARRGQVPLQKKIWNEKKKARCHEKRIKITIIARPP